MSHAAAQMLYWPPRILTIAFAVFLSGFALDVFEGAQGFWDALIGFAIHLIPAAVIVGVLVAAWKREWIAAGVYGSIAGLYTWSVLPTHMDWALILAGPLLVIAVLFLANWIERKQMRAAL